MARAKTSPDDNALRLVPFLQRKIATDNLLQGGGKVLNIELATMAAALASPSASNFPSFCLPIFWLALGLAAIPSVAVWISQKALLLAWSPMNPFPAHAGRKAAQSTFGRSSRSVSTLVDVQQALRLAQLFQPISASARSGTNRPLQSFCSYTA